MRSLVYSIVFLISIGTLHAQSPRSNFDYGLAFASHEVSKDHRTALDLNPNHAYQINKDFELEFDLAFQRLRNAYGYIVRVIANDSLNIDLMSTPEHEEFQDLTLIINNRPTNIQFDFSDVGLQRNAWTTFRFSFSFRRNEIALAWNGKTKSCSYNLSGLKNFRFYFGVNDFGRFNTTDAPPMVLRNISIFENNVLTRKWPLRTHHLNEVYDSLVNARAAVKNPVWLIDRHTRWTSRKTFTTGRFSSVAFNSDSALLYATDEHHLYTYDLRRERITRETVKGNPAHTDANQLLFIPEKNQLINYDVSTNKLLSFDFASTKWGNSDTAYQEPNYWHNNKFYNPTDDAVYTFGGYGHFTYHNEFLKYDAGRNTWEKIETKGSIPPRYLAASGINQSKDEVLIFGGYGSMSGKQELSPQSFYDLYSFDLKTYEVKKIRDYSALNQSEDIAYSNSLVLNESENCFYVLSYPKNKYLGHIRLRRYALDSTESNVLADSIPFHFHDEDSFCDLFYSAASDELVAVSVHEEKNGYQVQVHSINYPPLQFQDVLQPVPPEKRNAAVYGIVIAFLSLAGIFAYYYLNRRKKKKATPSSSLPQAREQTHPIPQPSFLPESNQPEELSKLTSSILFFGGFQIFDKNGTDISSKFTMTLKELFALIVLHSVKFEKGISATVIQEYLWPDKDEVSARNNRNVNVKKLRTLLEEIGGVSVENNNSYLKLTMGDQIFCDYQLVYKLLSRDKAFDENDKIGAIIANVKRGSLLPNLQASWLDSFKSDISNQVIDSLIEYSQKLDSNKDDKVLLEIADTVFMYDSINQEALVIKCSVLNKKGKYSLARTWYDHFAKEYKSLYAENYPRTFEDVIS